MADEQLDPRSLQREVRRLRDRQEILDCVNAYARGLDRLDADLLRKTFHTDGIDNHGPFIGTVDQFVPWAIEIESSFEWTHHGCTTHSCEIDGDVAHAESYVHFFVRMPDRKTVGAGGGRYVDKLERRNGRWAITIRRTMIDWSFEVPYSAWLGTDWERIRGQRNRQDPSYERPLSLPQPDKGPA